MPRKPVYREHNMANNLATAIIGTGFMGPVHTEALRRLGVQVYGILGSSPEKPRCATETLGVEKLGRPAVWLELAKA